MSPPPTLEAACNDVQMRMEKAIGFLRCAAQGRGEFVNAVADAYVRMHLAADELEEALRLMRRHVSPRVLPGSCSREHRERVLWHLTQPLNLMEALRRSAELCDLERVRQVRPQLNAVELDEEEEDE
jgi:hypothetical protein